jgi:hypothetical protein
MARCAHGRASLCQRTAGCPRAPRPGGEKFAWNAGMRIPGRLITVAENVTPSSHDLPRCRPLPPERRDRAPGSPSVAPATHADSPRLARPAPGLAGGSDPAAPPRLHHHRNDHPDRQPAARYPAGRVNSGPATEPHRLSQGAAPPPFRPAPQPTAPPPAAAAWLTGPSFRVSADLSAVTVTSSVRQSAPKVVTRRAGTLWPARTSTALR